MATDIFNVFLVATVKDREDFSFDNFFLSLGLSLNEPNPAISSFSSPHAGSSSRTCNICFCRLDMRHFESTVEYAEAQDLSINRCCDWLQERVEALRTAQERLKYTLYVEKFLSNRSGFTFPPKFVQICADLNLTLDFDIYSSN